MYLFSHMSMCTQNLKMTGLKKSNLMMLWNAPFHLSRVSVDVSRAPQPPPSIGTLTDFIKILSVAYVPQNGLYK